MIDTVKIAQLISRSQYEEIRHSSEWGKRYDSRTRELSNLYHKRNGKQYPYLSVFTVPGGNSYLTSTVSLPSFLFGSNARLINDENIGECLSRLSEYVTTYSGVDFDARSGKVWEVHFARDLKFEGVSTSYLMSQLADLNFQYFKNGRYEKSTVYLHSGKARTICIYDKHLDCREKSFSHDDILLTKNTIRFEYRYKTNSAVKRLVKNLELPNQNSGTVLNRRVSDFVLIPLLEQANKILRFSSGREKIVRITEKFGSRRASSLISHLVRIDVFGEKYYLEEDLNMKKQSYYLLQRDCRKIGIFDLFDKPDSNSINPRISVD